MNNLPIRARIPPVLYAFLNDDRTAPSWLAVPPRRASVLALLRMGATPERLAWSIAVGLVIGLNPLLGSTTFVCLAVAWAFRLNLPASQLANHLVYPLELLFAIPFIRAGSRLFHTAPLPLSAASLFHEVRTRPFALTRQLWLWEFHALVVWALAAVLLMPLLAFALTPALRLLLRRVQRREYPIVPEI